VGQPASIAAADVGALAVADLDEVPSDLHGPPEYRRRLGAVMVARALAEAIAEATSA
jgi:aerobic carbon-monoxide dehydrogenase medium subunit